MSDNVYKRYLEIPTFERCLDIVAHSKAFSHSVQEIRDKEIHSFKYNISIPGMWDETCSLNMRGLSFIDGKIVAFPFPKFFNLGEHENSTNIDISNPKYITEKIDGSLISIFRIGKDLECKTMKSVYSDTANYCRQYLTTEPDVLRYASIILDENFSPMFEYVTPKMRIVLNYPNEEFYYLGSRNLSTGEIIFPLQDHHINHIRPATIKTPQTFAAKDLNEYMDRRDVEGVVIVLHNNLMMKLKTAVYCKLHHIVTEITPKNIFENIINNKLDDAKGLLFQHNLFDDIKILERVENYYRDRYNDLLGRAQEYVRENRKKIAEELFRGKEKNDIAGVVMGLLDHKDVRNIIDKMLADEFKGKNLTDF